MGGYNSSGKFFLKRSPCQHRQNKKLKQFTQGNTSYKRLMCSTKENLERGVRMTDLHNTICWRDLLAHVKARSPGDYDVNHVDFLE